MLKSIPLPPGVRLVKNILIPTRDGVRLAADLYMPADAGMEARLPVVMDYIPYRKDEVAPGIIWSPSFYHYLPQHGYIVARVDIRGTGASEGINVDEYVQQEQEDGYDAIEWIARQPWCDGHVNMMGASYGGFTALQVASHAPPHLTSVIPVYFTDDRYTDDCHYRGGLLTMYYDVGWYGGRMIAWNAMPPYPEWSGDNWAQIWEQHLAHNEPYLLKWLNHQTDGPYWRPASVRDFPERIKCPVFMIGGWRDGYPNPPLRLYQALSVPRKVLIGPWNHAWPDRAIPGPRIDYCREVVRWLDHWCKGKDTGIMDEPPIAIYMQSYQEPIVDRLDTVGAWRSEIAWPPSGAAEKVLYLGGDNSLREKSGADGDDLFEYNPAVGVTGGLWSGGLPYGLPGDQRPDEAFSLVYTTPPLEEDVCILGWPHAILHVASSASVIGFSANLCDVAPDGASHLVAKGMLNATRRASLTNPQLLIPNEIYELDVQIDCTAWRFEKGHRIRLNVASADWPNVWPTPYPADNRVYRGSARPSRLVLPMVSATGSGAPPEFLPSPKVISTHSSAVQPPKWQIIRDVLSGRTTADIRYNLAFRVNDTTVIEREFSSVCQVDPSDPAHASIHGWHECRSVRPNQVTQGRTDVVIQSTETHFHITIDLEIRVNDAPHFNKRWVESVPRQLL
ncbi:MAG: CocE/NonD family hydrolase [Chloroflexi bacterium]|nr:CocE/NonD family hydrolase [Chloroflexota bacterium]